MAVKNKRIRYIGFQIVGGHKIDRKEFIRALRRAFSKDEYITIEPWLTVFTDNKGILRCEHTGKEKTIELLNSMDLGGGKVRTIVTGGTIKKVSKILFEE